MVNNTQMPIRWECEHILRAACHSVQDAGRKYPDACTGMPAVGQNQVKIYQFFRERRQGRIKD